MFTKEDTLKVKGIAIMLLLFHHLFYSDSVYAYRDIQFVIGNQNIVQKIAVASRVCVWIFVFLSAYGIALSYLSSKAEHESMSSFFKIRYFKLMNGYWFIYIITFVLSFLLFKNPIEIYQNNLIYMLFDLLALSDLFGTPMMSGVFWYMCFAQILLFLVPVLVEISIKFNFGVMIIIFVSMQYLDEGIYSIYGGEYVNYLFVATLGAYCASYGILDGKNEKSGKRYIEVFKAIILFLIACLFAYLKAQYSKEDDVRFTTVLVGISAFCIVVFIHRYIGRGIVGKVLMFFGKHSANIFLIHFFIYIYYSDFVYSTGNVLIIWLILLVVSCVCSMVVEFLKKCSGYNRLVKKITN